MGIQENPDSLTSRKLSTAINGDDEYLQELEQEDTAAALILYSLMFSKLSYETALELEKQKQKQKPPIPFKSQETPKREDFLVPQTPSLQEIPKKKQFFSIPRVPGLEGQIGECSKPMEKQLTLSDLRRNQTRLLLNHKHVQEYFYPLLSSNDIVNLKTKNGILVNVFDWRGGVYEMVFKLWGEKAHVLTSTNWITFLDDHGLKEQRDWITLWMFRLGDDEKRNKRLCFYLTSRSGDTKVVEKQRNCMSFGNGGSNKKRKKRDD